MGGYIAVEPGTVVTVPMEYQLPSEMVRPTGPNAFEYRLLVQKQPGMDEDRVTVAVELPSGAELLTASPAPTAREGRWVVMDFSLDSDTEVVVAFKVSG